MKKKILAVLMGLAMSVMLVSPAFAAGLSTAEQNLLNEFKEELNYWKTNAGLDDDHINQYLAEAEGALTAVDLPDAGCTEYSGAIKQIHDICVKANCKTRHELYSHVNEMLDILNTIGKKYNKLTVSVNATTKYATVTWEDVATGKTTTVASTAKVVKQTGFGLAQTAGVVVAAAATLGVAFVIARKKQLFVA
jgi:signal recognition particle GTPase